jgi:CMP-N-acetylneuraminic acid synthetase
MWWEDLVENETRLFGKIVPYIMPPERTINIDEPHDLELAKIIIGKNLDMS